MKKRTVITTEKREVWIVREGPQESNEDQGIDVSEPIDTVPLPASIPDLDSNERDDE